MVFCYPTFTSLGGTCGKLAYRTKGDGHLGTFLEASVYTGQSSENNHHRMVKYIPKKSSKYMQLLWEMETVGKP